MRRLAPVGLAIFLLLLLTGCGPGIGLDRDPQPLCTVGCILDVYPCVDPVTNRPASEGRSGCGPESLFAPATTPGSDPLPRSLAAGALLLALAALALLVLVWWVLGRARRRVPQPEGDGTSVDAAQLALPGLFGSAPTTSPPASTSHAARIRRLLPVGFVLLGVLVVAALALWVLHRPPPYHLNQFCTEPVDYVDVLLGAPVRQVPIDEACTVGVGSRTVAVGLLILALAGMASLALLGRRLDPDRTRDEPAPAPDDANVANTPDGQQTRLRRFAPVVIAVVILGGLAGWQAASSGLAPHGSISWRLSGYGGPGFDPATARTTTVLKVFVAQWPAEALIGDSWLAAPDVTYTSSSVTVTLRTSDAYRTATARLPNVGFYDTGGWVEVQLSEPLLGRALFDGSTFPPSARPYPTVAEASAAAAKASARASAAAAVAAANAPAASAAAMAMASAAAARASAEAQVAQASCSIRVDRYEARVIVEGDGSRATCQKLAEEIDLGSGVRMGSLDQPADAPSGDLICHTTVDRFEVNVYDTGSGTFGAIACRYLVPKPYLGIVVQEVSEGLRLKDTTGPTGRVSAVYPGGPASKAGLMAGDIVSRIDDTPIPTAADLDTIVAAHHIGDTLHLEVLRSGQTLSVDLVLEARPPTY